MKKINKGYWKNESMYIVEHNNIKYIRDESEMDGFHTIRWNKVIPDENKRIGGPLHYYSADMGWNDETGHLNKKQPPPELEIEYKKMNVI